MTLLTQRNLRTCNPCAGTGTVTRRHDGQRVLLRCRDCNGGGLHERKQYARHGAQKKVSEIAK